MNSQSILRDACIATSSIDMESCYTQTSIDIESRATQTSPKTRNQYTQTYRCYKAKVDEDISQIPLTSISDLVHVLKDQFANWNSIHDRLFSVIIYVLLRQHSVDFETVRNVLKQLDCLQIQTAHGWAKTLHDEDDPLNLCRDERGEFERDTFYAHFPDLEEEAKMFAKVQCSKKNCSFTVKDLAVFINKRHLEMLNEKDNDKNNSEASEDTDVPNSSDDDDK